MLKNEINVTFRLVIMFLTFLFIYIYWNSVITVIALSPYIWSTQRHHTFPWRVYESYTASSRDKIVANCIKSIATHAYPRVHIRERGKSCCTCVYMFYVYTQRPWSTNGPVTSNSGRTTIAREGTIRSDKSNSECTIRSKITRASSAE